jgi:predicted phage terminase large subunit-like protein
MNYPEQRRFVLSKMFLERGVEHGIEAAMHGQALVDDIRREWMFRASAFRAIRVTTDKVTRALSWSNLAEAGKVFLVRGPWNAAFIEEAAAFPKGANDDQIDAVSIAVHLLSTKRHIATGF